MDVDSQWNKSLKPSFNLTKLVHTAAFGLYDNDSWQA